jgi:cytochrome oxidase Cu insertion factor (SCO1/SenC/PrrC family)
MSMRRVVAAAALALTVALPGSAVLAHDDDAPRPVQRVARAAAGWPAEPFALADTRGGAFTHEQLMRRWTFVLFGDAGCGARCADALRALDGVYRRIAGTAALETTQVLVVWPGAPERLRVALAAHDARFVGATAAPAVLARLADDWTVPRGDGAAPAGLVLVGPDASARAEYLPPWDVKLLTADYLKTRLRR